MKPDWGDMIGHMDECARLGECRARAIEGSWSRDLGRWEADGDLGTVARSTKRVTGRGHLGGLKRRRRHPAGRTRSTRKETPLSRALRDYSGQCPGRWAAFTEGNISSSRTHLRHPSPSLPPSAPSRLARAHASGAAHRAHCDGDARVADGVKHALLITRATVPAHGLPWPATASSARGRI